MNHVYDDLGRLRMTTDASGNTVEYVYDAVGNILKINRYTATQLAIVYFSPRSGAVGSSVTINGSGFSTTAASNTVNINTTAATVTSASVNRLVVTVPSGATTGKISVKVGTITVTSTDNFTVAALSAAPTITGFTPSIVKPGDTLTVTGTNFSTLTKGNTVTFQGGAVGRVTATSTTSVSITVPSVVRTGTITLTTASGRAVSSQEIFVLPSGSGKVTTDMASALRMNIGTTNAAYSISQAGKVGLVAFDGLAGQNVSFTLSSLTANSTGIGAPRIQVFAPDGTVVGNWDYLYFGIVVAGLQTGAPDSADVIFNNGGSRKLVNLPVTGTYTALITPRESTTTISGNITVSADAAYNLTVNGSSVSVPASNPGQIIRLGFSGTAGQNLGLGITNLVTGMPVDFSEFFDFLILKPDGTLWFNDNQIPNVNNFDYIMSRSGGTETAGHLGFALSNLPQTGNYTVLLTAARAEKVAFTATLNTDPTATLTSSGAAVVGSAAKPGQSVRYTFAGTAGQGAKLRFSNISVSGSTTVPTNYGSPRLMYEVFKPDGSYLSGTSSVIDGGVPGTLAPPDGTLDLPLLPATGTYSVLVSAVYNTSTPLYGLNAATFTLSTQLVTDVTANLVVNAAPTPISTTIPSQRIRATFNVTAGQNLSVSASELTANSTTLAAPSLKVYLPDGSEYTNIFYLISGSRDVVFDLGGSVKIDNAPVSGTYSVVVAPAESTTTVGLKLNVASDIPVAITPNGASPSLSTTLPGQTVRLTFSGTAGQNLGLGINNLLTGVPVNFIDYAYWKVIRPDGSVWDSISGLYSSTGYVMRREGGTEYVGHFGVTMPNLPMTGTYTVLLTPARAEKFTATATLSSDLTGSLVSGTPLSVNVTRPAQVARLSFNATGGQSAKLFFSNVVITGATFNGYAQYNYFTVYGPTGNVVASIPSYGPTVLDLSFATTGTYQVVVQPPYATTTSFDAYLVNDYTVSPLSINGMPTAVPTTLPGQRIRATFDATAGQDISVSVTGLTANSTTLAAPAFSVIMPNGYLLQDGYPLEGYSTNVVFDLGGSRKFVSAPLTGTYVVMIDPAELSTRIGFNVQAVGGQAVSLTTGAASLPITMNRPGEIVKLSFAGTAGQNLNVAITQILSTMTVDFSDYFNWRIQAPNGSIVAFAYAYQGAGGYVMTRSSGVETPGQINVALTNLPATGTYTMYLSPGRAEKVNFKAAVTVVP